MKINSVRVKEIMKSMELCVYRFQPMIANGM